MDRHGAPRLMAGGSLLAALILGLMAIAPTLWVFAALLILLEIAAALVLYDAAFAALVLLRGPSARRAITRLTLIAGFASTIFWPATGWMVEAWGWRASYGVFAGLHLTLCLGLHLWLSRQAPADPTLRPGGPREAPPVTPLPAALAARAYPFVAVSFALSGAVIAAFGVHMVPVLAAVGLGAGATVAAMLMGPAQVAIRLVDALFWKGLHPLTVACVSALAIPLAIAGLAAGLAPWLAGPAFAALFGIGQGLSSIVRGSVPLALFGPQGYGARLGRLALIRTFASAGAPFAFAALQAATGVAVTLWAFGILALAGALPLLVLRAELRRAGELGDLR
jgi:hypothetical protein